MTFFVHMKITVNSIHRCNDQYNNDAYKTAEWGKIVVQNLSREQEY